MDFNHGLQGFLRIKQRVKTRSDVRCLLFVVRGFSCSFPADISHPVKETQQTVSTIHVAGAPVAARGHVAGFSWGMQAAAYLEPGMNVLLVEDHYDSREAFSRLLRAAGCRVECAQSVKSAIAACRVRPFDLLISDIDLPDGDGWNMLQHIRNFANFPAIALTAYTTAMDRQRSRESGFAEHLSKPATFKNVLSAIQRVTGDGLRSPGHLQSRFMESEE